MNPNLNSHLGLHHPHQHHHHPHQHPSSSQLHQSSPSAHSLHSTAPHHHQAHQHHSLSHHLHSLPSSHPSHLHPNPSPAHLTHPHPSQRPPDFVQHPSSESIDQNQAQQRSNIEHYKSSANPAFRGYIQSTHDALILFNACDNGDCPKVTRRLHERERRSINSGAVYVFDEAEAGIKRWTDGRIWSPSRILNNFLVYREIDQKRTPAGPSSNQPASTTNSSSQNNRINDDPDHPHNTFLPTPSTTPGSTSASHHQRPPQSTNPHHPSQSSSSVQVSKSTDLSSSPSSSDSKPTISAIESHDRSPQSTVDHHHHHHPPPASTNHQVTLNREKERALVGSLTSTYKFRPDGLVKKTISVAGMHMISYYKMEDVLAGRLRTPSSHPMFYPFKIADRFLQPAFFRVPPTWGYSNEGLFWLHDESPDEPCQISPNPTNTTTTPTSCPGIATTPTTSTTTTTTTTTTNPTTATTTPSTNPANSANSTTTHHHHSPQFHNPNRSSNTLTLSNPHSITSSNSVQGLLTAHHHHPPPPLRPILSDRIPSSGLSRPGSSASSTGSPSATSPVSSHTFPLLSTSNLNPPSSTGPTSVSPVINSVGGRSNFSSLQASNTSSITTVTAHSNHSNNIPTTSGTSSPNLTINRSSASTTTSTRYEPYPRPNRLSPPSLSTSPTSNSNTLSDHQLSVSYYNSQPHATSHANGYTSHSFLSEPHSSSSLVSQSPQQPSSQRNNRPNLLATDPPSLDSNGQVSYGDSGSYRSTASACPGGESLYASYATPDAISTSPRSASVPPSPYGLPSITRIGGLTPQGSSTSTNSTTNGNTRHLTDYPYSTSASIQPSNGRLSSSNGGPSGPYGTFLSAPSNENPFRNPTLGGAGLSGTRDSHAYNSPAHPSSALDNSSNQSNAVSGTQSTSFLYHSPSAPSSATSTTFPPTYPFSNPMQTSQGNQSNRRASAMATLSGEVKNEHEDPTNRAALRVGTDLGRMNGSSLHQAEDDNPATPWSQIGSSQVMKTEEGAGG